MTQLLKHIETPNGFSYEQPLGLFINNEIVPSSEEKTIEAIDPATEDVIAEVHAATADDVNTAVHAARAALKDSSWTTLGGTERGIMISKLADLIESKKELLASVDAWDNGKPFSVALNEDLPETILTFRYYSGWADKIFGQTIGTSSAKFAYTLRQPIGVVAQIIPWNYPLSMAAWKLAPALACGNTVVLKAAEQTPLSVLLLGQLIKEAGFPPGVVNILNGYGREAGAALVQHALVDKVAFTGSTVTARSILTMAAKTLKNVTIETGGKSPLLVFADADIGQAVKWSHLGIMSHQGQICTATSRILVQQDIYDSFVASFKERVRTTSIMGDQWGPDTYQGPQVSRDQYNRILSYIQEGLKEGANLEMGGAARPINGKGYFIQPTVFTNVKDHMTIYREEIFGPVVVIASFSTEEEAVARANDSIYGLGAAIFTQNLERAHRVATKVESGTVWVNSSQDCDPRVPFGGVKQSGIGRELGEAALDAYTQIKAVHINLGSKL